MHLSSISYSTNSVAAWQEGPAFFSNLHAGVMATLDSARWQCFSARSSVKLVRGLCRHTTRCVLGVAQLPYNRNRSCSTNGSIQQYTDNRSTSFVFSVLVGARALLFIVVGDGIRGQDSAGAKRRSDWHGGRPHQDDRRFHGVRRKDGGLFSCPQLACFAVCCSLLGLRNLN